jgi:ketosteroid isomerase-like protein
MGEAEQVARSYWAAESARDLDRVMDHYNPDATFTAPGYDLHGREAILRFYQESAARFPGLSVAIGPVTGGGSNAAIEWRATFTTPTGSKVFLRGVNVIETGNGKFQHVRVYYDRQELDSQA